MKRLLTVLLALCLLALLPAAVRAADPVTEVATVAQLKAALQNDAGAHIRLTADIIFTQADGEAEDPSWGVIVGEGFYTIDLNGYRIEYSYMWARDDYTGSPLITRSTRGLTINGPGSIVGGSRGIEQSSRGILTINGGTLKGVMAYGLRMTNGIAVINGGEITGNFGGIDHEDGVIVQSGGSVQSIGGRAFQPRQNYGIIDQSGVFTGEARLEDAVLVMDDLTISPGSGITVERGGGLIVTGSFTNNGAFTYDSGLKCVDGNALVTMGEHHSRNYIVQDVTFATLTLEQGAELYITNGATVTVTGAYVNAGGEVVADNGNLQLLGSIDHRGRSRGVPQLDGLDGGAGPSGPDDPGETGPGALTRERNFTSAYDAAMRLKALGLFQGVGLHPDGAPNFDLHRAPSRTEALVMLIRLLGQENDALRGHWEHPFTDVPEWADKYVGYAYERDITNGVSATEFGVGDASGQMYLTFVLRALGYSDAGGADFTWDDPGSLAEAVTILPPGVHLNDFLRADVALISEAALAAKIKGSRDTLLDKLITDGVVTP